MASADLVQTNGLGLSLVSAMKRVIAACSSTIDVKTPRLSLCRVSLANRPSTALAQEHEVGVKWCADAVAAMLSPWGACGWHSCRAPRGPLCRPALRVRRH